MRKLKHRNVRQILYPRPHASKWQNLSLNPDNWAPEFVLLTPTPSCFPRCPCRVPKPGTAGTGLRVPKCAYVFGWLHLVKFRANCYTIDWALEWSKKCKEPKQANCFTVWLFSSHRQSQEQEQLHNNAENTGTSWVYSSPPPETKAPKTLPAKTLDAPPEIWKKT